MSKLTKMIWSMCLVCALFLLGMLLADKQYLHNNVIRLRVVANSDSVEDQQIKLAVRDAVTGYLNSNMKNISDVEAAKKYLSDHIAVLSEVAATTLFANGCDADVDVYLSQEAAATKEYATFRLPSGVYDTLRIDIGSAAGENWWCVVFPALCMPTTDDGFRSAAVSAGFDKGLTDALSKQEDVEIRFFLLDCIGKLEKIFCTP